MLSRWLVVGFLIGLGLWVSPLSVLSHVPSTSAALAAPPEPDGENCWVMTTTRDALNLLGERLYTYQQMVRWCMDDSRVFEHHANPVGNPHMFFWKFDGHTRDEESILKQPSGDERLLAIAQGSFTLCMFEKIGCIRNEQPWIEQVVGGDGYYEERTDQ